MCSKQMKEQNTATKNLNGNAAEESQKKHKEGWCYDTVWITSIVLHYV